MKTNHTTSSITGPDAVATVARYQIYRQPLLELRTLAGADALDRALALLDTVPGLPDRQAWLCGPPPVVGRFAQALRAHGVPSDRIHAESFDFR